MTRSSPLTVLVADEPMALDHIADYFDGDPGVSAVTVTSPETALERIHSTSVDCLVSDGLVADDGRPLVEAARRAVPALPTVLYSAGAPGTVPAGALDAVVEKDEPTSLDALRAVIGLVTRPDDARMEPPETDDRHWRVLGYYDWRATSDPVTTLLLALAGERDVDVFELDPLHDVVDPDALNRLFAADADAPDPVEVEFRYEGVRIHVASDGLVACR